MLDALKHPKAHIHEVIRAVMLEVNKKILENLQNQSKN